MKDRIFSPALFLQMLRRLKTVGVAMLLAVCILNLFSPIASVFSGTTYHEIIVTDVNGNYVRTDLEPRMYEVDEAEFAPFLWLMLAFAPIVTYTAFSFLHDRTKADFYHAIPKTRVCTYLSTLAAALVLMLGTVVVSVAINAFFWWISPYDVFTAQTALVANLLYFLVLTLFLSSLTALAVMLTGTLAQAVLTFLWLILFPPIIAFLYEDMLVHTVTVLKDVSLFRSVLSASRFLVVAAYTDLGSMLWYAALSVLIFTAAALLYRARRSEAAGRASLGKIPRMILRTLLTMLPAVAAVNLTVRGEDLPWILFFVIASVVVYLVYELMTTKKLAMMLRAVPMLVIPLALSVLFGASVYGVRAYVHSVRPKGSEIASVAYLSRSGYLGYGAEAMMGERITDIALLETVAKDLQTALDDEYLKNGENAVLRIRLKNGYTFERNFRVSADVWKRFCTAEENLEKFLRIPAWEEIGSIRIPPLDDSRTLTNLEKDAWEIFTEEYAALTDGEKLRVLYDGDLSYAVDKNVHPTYCMEAVVYLDDRQNGNASRYTNVSILLSPALTPKTVEYITAKRYGGNDNVLRLLREIQSENQKYGSFETLWLWDGTECRKLRAAEFFDAVTLDSHLFKPTEDCVRISFGENKYDFLIYLTEAERKALG